MKAIVVIWMLFAGLLSCVPATTEVVPLSGTYIGYFHQKGKDTARVTLRFADNRFDGITNKEAYPAMGSGRFKQSSSALVFLLPFHNAIGFDRQTTLEGEYNYHYNEDGTLRIWKENGQSEDEFILKAYTGETVMGSDAGTPHNNNSTFQ